MVGIDSLRNGLLGVQRGQDGLKRGGRQIIRANVPSPMEGSPEPGFGILKPLANPSSDRNQVAAGAKVVKTFEDTLGTLLDVKA